MVADDKKNAEGNVGFDIGIPVQKKSDKNIRHAIDIESQDLDQIDSTHPKGRTQRKTKKDLNYTEIEDDIYGGEEEGEEEDEEDSDSDSHSR